MGFFSSEPKTYDEFLDKAKKYAKKGKTEEAMDLLNKAVQSRKGTTGELFLVFGQIYSNLGSIKEAIKSYRKGIEYHPDFVDNYFDLAVTYGQQSQHIRKNLMDYPIGYLAETIERTHEYLLKASYLKDNEAKKLLIEEGFKFSSKNDILNELFNIAQKRNRRNNWKGARSIYDFVLKFDPDNKIAKQGILDTIPINF